MGLQFGNDEITAGVTLISQALQSQNFVNGVSGWQVTAAGDAQFNNGTFRGQLTANAISATSIGGSQITDSDFQGGTMEDTAITMDSSGGYLLAYSNISNATTLSTAGASTYTVPAGVTTLTVAGWGGGGGGQGGSGAAGSGGEYALDTLSVTPGETLTVVVGAGGTGGTTVSPGAGGVGIASKLFRGGTGGTLIWNAVGGHGGTSGFTPGGTGSIAATHFDGGSSTSGSSGRGSGGAGGGAGASSSGTGAPGNPNSGSQPGFGGTGAGGGGTGGVGGFGTGSTGSPGAAGLAPGGGGGSGGLGSSSPGVGGNGAVGKVTLSYTTNNILEASVSPVAFTDPLGNSVPAGVGANDLNANTATIANATVTGSLTVNSGVTALAYLSAGNRIVGSTSITPTAANTPTTKVVTFPFTLSGTTFIAQVTALSAVPGTTVTGCSASAVSATSVSLVVTRTNTTATTLMYTVEGV